MSAELATILAIVSPLFSVVIAVGAFMMRFQKNETKTTGDFNLVNEKLAGLKTAQDDAKTSRIQLRESGRSLDLRIQNLETVCKLTHQDRGMPKRTATVDLKPQEVRGG